MQRLENNIQMRENGKTPILATSPRYYLDTLYALIAMGQIPKAMQHKDDFRNINMKNIATIIDKIITDDYKSERMVFKKYNEETPINKVLIWGTMFNTLLKFFADTTPQDYERYGYINKEDYKKIPKRYRDAIKKHKDGYIIVAKRSAAPKLSLMFENDNNEKQFNDLINEAKKLVPVIYTVNKNVYWATPSTLSQRRQKFVSNEQIAAIKRLRTIFENIIDLVVFIKTKSNAHATIAEYLRELHNKNIVLKAQRYIRTVSQVVVSAKKNSELFDSAHFAGNYIKQTEKRYKNTRNQVINTIRDRICSR